jgi:hypothetical protein
VVGGGAVPHAHHPQHQPHDINNHQQALASGVQQQETHL